VLLTSDAPQYRARMTFPRKLLIPGERLILELRPHWVAISLPILVVLAASIGATWLTLGVFDSGSARGIVWIAWVVILVLYPVRRIVWWLTSIFVVTSSRVIHREGFIAKRSMEIPLDKINDVRFEQGIWDRIVGAGTLVIQSASEAGRNEFSFIRHPEEVQKTIYHASEEDQRPSTPVPVPVATPPPPPAPAPAGSAPNVTTELERLAELRARGVLTEAEFQAQKARILGGGS